MYWRKLHHQNEIKIFYAKQDPGASASFKFHRRFLYLGRGLTFVLVRHRCLEVSLCIRDADHEECCRESQRHVGCGVPARPPLVLACRNAWVVFIPCPRASASVQPRPAAKRHSVAFSNVVSSRTSRGVKLWWGENSDRWGSMSGEVGPRVQGVGFRVVLWNQRRQSPNHTGNTSAKARMPGTPAQRSDIFSEIYIPPIH